MTKLEDAILEDAVQDVIDELNPDGGGYLVDEAVDLLVFRAEAAQGTKLPPHIRRLMRIGARAALEEMTGDA